MNFQFLTLFGTLLTVKKDQQERLFIMFGAVIIWNTER
ncbi:uncharacterized protein METZ01_LOCUS394769, partial [marine metagenome]